MTDGDPKDGDEEEPAPPAVNPSTPAKVLAPAPAKAAAKPSGGGRIEDPPARAPAPPRQKTPQDLGHPGDPPPWWRTLRADPPFLIRLGLGGAMMGLILLLWWFVTRGGPTEAIISPVKLPSPGHTIGQLHELMQRNLGENIIASLERVLKGILLAAVVGIGLGVVAGSQRGVAAALNPIVVFFRSVPMGAMVPLTLVWFGTEERQKWTFIFLAVVAFVFSDTVKAVSSVPQRYVETAETLGASRFQIIRKVLVPLALPDIVTSLRFQFGLAFGYIVLAETGAILTTGIGPMFEMNGKRGLIEHTYLLLFILALIAFAIDIGIRYFQRGIFPYRKDL